jgi:hypothetical protein
MGMYASADGQIFMGGTEAADGGISLGYLFPRDWFPGRLQLRGMLRYFREDVALLQPTDNNVRLGPEDELRLIPLQESYLGFVGIDWKL